MKKIVFGLLVISVMSFLTSCEPDKNENVNDELQNLLEQSDKDEEPDRDGDS